MKLCFSSFEVTPAEVHRRGYEIYEDGDMYEIHFISMNRDEDECAVRLPKKMIGKSSFSKGADLYMMYRYADAGMIDNAVVQYRGLWYTQDEIHRLKEESAPFGWKSAVNAQRKKEQSEI